MKKKNRILILSFSFFILITINSSSQGTWTQMTSFAGTARTAAASFSIGTKGYLGTGLDASNPRQDFWEYDPATGAWTQRADFGGGPRIAAVCLSIGNKGYIGLGSSTYPVYTWPTDFW